MYEDKKKGTLNSMAPLKATEDHQLCQMEHQCIQKNITNLFTRLFCLPSNNKNVLTEVINKPNMINSHEIIVDSSLSNYKIYTRTKKKIKFDILGGKKSYCNPLTEKFDH